MKKTMKTGGIQAIPFSKQMKRALMLALLPVLGLLGSQIFAAGTTAMVSPASVAPAEGEHTVTGKITDANGVAIPGATIVIKGEKVGTVADADGKFSLSKVPENAILQISFIGMKTQEIALKGRSVITVSLEDAAISLNEVVAVGYGVQQKKVLTGATVQVSGADIQKLNTTSTLGALQGNTPGVQLTKTDGQPGDGFHVTIRGMGTIYNSTPLYVVDGVIVGSIDNLSPSDIQSVDVLKDATASIYGARAANGVILITTKQGKPDEKPTITYDGYYGWQNLYRTANTLNAQQYLTIVNEGMVNGGSMPYDITGTATSLNGNDNGAQVPLVPNAAGILNGTYKGTNWMKAITNADAPIQNHAFNIVGGSARSSYSIGLAFMSQQGVLGKPVESDYKRYNIRINSDHKLIVGSDNRVIWKFGQNLNYSYNEKSGIAVGNGYWNDIYDMEEANPFLPIYGAKGLYSYPIPWDHLQNNPIASMVNVRGQNMSKNHNLMVSFYTTISPIKNLEFTSRFSSNISASSYRSFEPKYDLGSVSTDNTATGTSVNITAQSMSVGLNWIWENFATYKFNLHKDHNFSFMAGQSAEKDGLGESMNTQNTGNVFNTFEYAYISNAATINASNTVIGGSNWGAHQIASYFGRFNYDYMQKYLFSAVYRADGSSNFATGHRWGGFPAFSGAWLVTEEPFMKSTKSWLDYLKIRASWGKNGNENIGNFNYASTVAIGGTVAASYYTFGAKDAQTSAAYPNIIANPDVTWEKSEQTDVGFDANLLHSRLNINFDLYDKITKGWLVQAPIPDVAGASAPWVNGGNITNKGIELGAGWSDNIGKFHYKISANIAYNHNEVTSVKGGGLIYGATGFYGNNSSWYVAGAGMPAGCFYGYKTDGIFQNEAEIKAYKNSSGGLIMPNAVPGDIKFVDINGDGKIDTNDRTNIGNSHPPVNYGMSIVLSYKGFDFNLQGTGVSGNKVVQATDWNSLNDPLGNYTAGILNRWHGEGTSNTMPRVSLNGNLNNEYFSDMWLQSGAYFRVSNITLGYDFKTIWKSSPLQQIRLYATLQNALVITKYRGMDPEVGYAPDSWSQGIDIGNYPSPRTFMIGASLKF